MDPNKCLADIRMLVSVLKTPGNECPEDIRAEDVQDLLDNVEALDTWLSAGGFLPKEWTRER